MDLSGWYLFVLLICLVFGVRERSPNSSDFAHFLSIFGKECDFHITTLIRDKALA